MSERCGGAGVSRDIRLYWCPDIHHFNQAISGSLNKCMVLIFAPSQALPSPCLPVSKDIPRNDNPIRSTRNVFHSLSSSQSLPLLTPSTVLGREMWMALSTPTSPIIITHSSGPAYVVLLTKWESRWAGLNSGLHSESSFIASLLSLPVETGNWGDDSNKFGCPLPPFVIHTYLSNAIQMMSLKEEIIFPLRKEAISKILAQIISFFTACFPEVVK